MVRDAFLTDELVRIDCKGLPISDYKKIGVKLRVSIYGEVRAYWSLLNFFFHPRKLINFCALDTFRL